MGRDPAVLHDDGRAGHDGVAYSVVTSPNADHIEPGFLGGSNHLHAGGSRKPHILALFVFRGMEISTGIGLRTVLLKWSR